MNSNLFAAHTHWETDPNPLALKLAELKALKQNILDLTLSNPTKTNFDYFKSSLLEPFQNANNLQYDPDPRGLKTARSAICHYYEEKGIILDPRQVFITASTSEAYSLVFKLLMNPGEKILAPQPSYPLLDFLTHADGIETVKFPLQYQEQSWQYGGGAFQNLSIEKFKAVLIVNPNNPTGNFFQDSLPHQWNKISKSHGFSWIADEVFLDYPLTSLRPYSFTRQNERLTFTLSGISKVLGMPQMKLSWIIITGPSQEREEAISRLENLSDLYLSASTPIQNALPSWFEKKDIIQFEIRSRIQDNFEFLKSAVTSFSSLIMPKTEGGWCTPLKLPQIKSDEAWALNLLEKAQTLVHPGYLYDFSDDSWIVLSLMTKSEEFKEGIRRILNCVDKETSN